MRDERTSVIAVSSVVPCLVDDYLFGKHRKYPKVLVKLRNGMDQLHRTNQLQYYHQLRLGHEAIILILNIEMMLNGEYRFSSENMDSNTKYFSISILIFFVS